MRTYKVTYIRANPLARVESEERNKKKSSTLRTKFHDRSRTRPLYVGTAQRSCEQMTSVRKKVDQKQSAHYDILGVSRWYMSVYEHPIRSVTFDTGRNADKVRLSENTYKNELIGHVPTH